MPINKYTLVIIAPIPMLFYQLTVWAEDVLDPYVYMKDTELAPFTLREINMSDDLGFGASLMMRFTGPYLHNPLPPDGLRTVGPTLEVVLSDSTASIL